MKRSEFLRRKKEIQRDWKTDPRGPATWEIREYEQLIKDYEDSHILLRLRRKLRHIRYNMVNKFG